MLPGTFEEFFGRFTGQLPGSPILVESWRRSEAAGLDPSQPPAFRRVPPDELENRRAANRLLLDVAVPHLRWLSRWLAERPHVAYLVDAEGVVLHAEGDAAVIERFALSPGYDWSEVQMGTNGAGTALVAKTPVAVIGCDHWSSAWKDATCLAAPVFGPDGELVGAIDISMDVKDGDAERLVVAAHVAYAVSQELRLRHAHDKNRTKDALHATAQRALDAERRARQDLEAALADHREAEEALRESEARLSLAFEHAAMGLWELDLSRGTCRWSEHTAMLFGLPRGENAGSLERFLDLVHPEDRASIVRATRAAMEGGPYEVEFRTTWPDGTLHWIHGKGHVTAPAAGQGPRLVGVGQDITARRDAEATLRISQEWLRTIIDSSPALVYVVDSTGRFRLINRHFANLFGIDPNHVVGRSVFEYFEEEVARQFAANNSEVLNARAIREFEEVVTHADGAHTYISVKAPLYDADGVPYAICGVSTDITERTRLYSALEAAQRQKDALIAVVAHELRQPLGAIQTGLALMQARVDPGKSERARTVVERQVRHLARLVDDLLDASRISQGSVTLRLERIALRDPIEAAINVVRPLVEERHQTLRVDLPEMPMWLDADSVRIQQVFSNLLTNAAKFTPPEGTVALTAAVEDDASVTVRVLDTGQGIAPEMLSHIFDLFAQTTPDGRGLGIGLAVVRGLVELHGGSVHASSRGLGHGSEFVVRLPLAGRG